MKIDLDQLVRAFSSTVDLVGVDDVQHGKRVAFMALSCAETMGLGQAETASLCRLGLLHDLGKLQVPDEVLELEGSLNWEELAYMRHHSYVTYQILKKIRGIEDIALWAASHHEKLDGSGYPFHKTAKDLCLESRIITIADIFQALAQNRPYRTSQSLEKILEHLKKRVVRGQLDPELVKLVDSERHACYAVATASS
jgi:putative nucleotidyltransferase with HDIG domain